MDVHNVELTISAVRPDQYPKDGLPEITLTGRSNVGKSSLINTLIKPAWENTNVEFLPDRRCNVFC